MKLEELRKLREPGARGGTMTEEIPATRIETLRLSSYRRFESLQLDFDPGLTVLVASNGGGKTAILEGLAATWEFFLDELIRGSGPSRLSRDDVRRIIGVLGNTETSESATLATTALVNGAPTTWTRHVLKSGETLTDSNPAVASVQAIASELHHDVMKHAAGQQASSPTLPLLCYYGTGRLWNTRKVKPSKKEEKADTSRFSGYTDCLSPASSFRFFEAWFKRFSYEAQSELSSGRASPHRPGERLKAVRAAVDTVLSPSGWCQLEWDFAEDTLVASHPDHGRLPVRLLSDGIRNMIGLVGDVAHRCARMNPHLGAAAASTTPGIVLIDEVDMHLHPGWQQTVVGSLCEAFPAVQLVVTTHSHLVISTVPSRCVRILGSDGSVSLPSVETQGYDSPLALGVVFGVDSRPPVLIARQLAEYRALVEQGQGDAEAARELRQILVTHFGERHPAVLAADGLRRLREFKARVGARQGGT